MNSNLDPTSGLRDQAIALRRAGRSRREIKGILGITSNSTLNTVLAGEPPPEWTSRPNAKDALRAQARALRQQGLTYNRIAEQLGVFEGLHLPLGPRPAASTPAQLRRVHETCG